MKATLYVLLGLAAAAGVVLAGTRVGFVPAGTRVG